MTQMPHGSLYILRGTSCSKGLSLKNLFCHRNRKTFLRFFWSFLRTATMFSLEKIFHVSLCVIGSWIHFHAENGLVAAVTATTTKPKRSISETYIGSCNDDDVACAQSCADENLISGKCEPIPKNGLIRACFCQGSAGLVVAVTATTTKPKPCIGNYEGSCIDDDEACAQSCAADNLTGGKCGQYGKSGSTRICYCQGCAGTTPEPTVAEATTTSTTSISSIVWPSYLQPGPRRTCEDAVISGQDCRTCTTSTDNGTSTWKQQCLTREPDFEDPVAATSRPCEIIVNHQGLSCTRCYTVSGLRTNWNEQCLPSPATSVRQSDNPSPEANDRQCRELKKGTQTCTHCTWLENGRSRWKEDCR